MVALQGFPACCGADVLTGFGTGSAVTNPNATCGYKTDISNYKYILDKNGKQIPITFADKFRKDIETRRVTYPNRMYCCILNVQQYEAHNSAWPKFLKLLGFEFVRQWSNSSHDMGGTRRHPIYLFVLCTDLKGRCEDFIQPPPGWDDLPTTQEPSLLQRAKDVLTGAKAA